MTDIIELTPEMRKQALGAWWLNKTPEEQQKHRDNARKRAEKRWSETSKEERKNHASKMAKKRWEKHKNDNS